MAKVYQISVSNGGVPKLPVDAAHVNSLGLSEDRQAHPEFHGGPDRAVCLYSLEVIEALQAEGHPIFPGAAGENVTVSGLDWSEVVPGVQLRLGEVRLEVTGYATPCNQQTGWFADGRFTRIHNDKHPGESRVYARVTEEGHLRTGDEVELLRG